MDRRQGNDGNGMSVRYGKFARVGINRSATEWDRLDLKIRSSQSTLDCNLPHTGGTEQKVIVLAVNQRPRRIRQQVGPPRRPQQQMRIQQEGHELSRPNRPSISFAPMRSK